MGKYYHSSKDDWETEKSSQDKVSQGISVLDKIDAELSDAFQDLSSDRYGLMGTYGYDRQTNQIKQCEDKNEALINYAKGIYGILEEKESDFCSALSKAFEELSLLNITDYTTENTLGITERKQVPIAYYHGNMALNSGQVTKYEMRDVLKGKLNIIDIQMKTDVLGIEEQIEAYLRENNGKLTNAELTEVKEEYYQSYLQTSFEHEVYNDGWVKALSTTLDFIPVVGGVKNVIEGICGYTMTGEKLSDQERVSYGIMGVLTTAVDIVSLGTAGGLIKGGTAVGKAAVKQVGKAAIMDSVSSVTIGWTSQFAMEKLSDMGLSAEAIFIVHTLAGIATTGIGKKITDPPKQTHLNKMEENISTKLNRLNERNRVNDVDAAKQEYLDKVKGFNHDTATNLVKGNYSEITTDFTVRFGEQFEKEKYKLELISNTVPDHLNALGHKGIDGIYKNVGENRTYDYMIVEAKYNTAKLNNNTLDGRQMSDPWINGEVSEIDRIGDAVGDERLANQIKRSFEIGKVARILSEVDVNGNVKTFLLNEKGYKIGVWP